eukprot:3506006-Pyramimonas_sp.AAC.1
MDFRNVTYVPALYKIFDEILANSEGNLQRDKTMNYIKVEVDTKQKRIKVTNNGKGLPIAIHKKHKVYVPELVFGHLLTCDNYDGYRTGTRAGTRGYGNKTCQLPKGSSGQTTWGAGGSMGGYRVPWTPPAGIP